MLSEMPLVQPAALFLFAHQDDEFGVFQTIITCRQQGLRVVCAYLTEGSHENTIAAQRDRESRRVLTSLGVLGDDIVFAGTLLAIPDASLPDHLPAATRWVRSWFHSFPHIDLICIPAWEGGHHDHDALHAVVVHIAQAMAILPAVRQFPLYHRRGCPGPSFRVLSPLAANGPVQETYLSWRSRVRFLRLCLSYPSQLRTWIGLFPFVFLHFMIAGMQSLQGVSLERIKQKPHEGLLYYERRKFFTWKKMQEKLINITANNSMKEPKA